MTIEDRCQMHALKVFRSPVWLLRHKLSSPHYGYIRKMRRGDRLPLTQKDDIDDDCYFFLQCQINRKSTSNKTRYRQ
jgi:hypothetical protein